MNALIYRRVSGSAQLEGDGFQRQTECCQSFAQKNGFTVSGVYEDDVSGTKESVDRPGLTALFAAAASGSVVAVLVERADRLARDLIVSELLIAEFKKLGLKVIEAATGTDLTNDEDPSRKLIRQILAAVAEWDKSVLVRKMRIAKDRIRARGERCEGRKPFGGDPTKPDERFVVEQMLNWRFAGASVRMIANMANRAGLKTRMGKPWTAGTVSAIVSREG